MQNYLELKLIEGIFTSEDAHQVILALINKKIDFHTLEVLSIKERTDEPNEHSEIRIKALNESKVRFSQFILKLKQEDKLDINCKIEIKVI